MKKPQGENMLLKTKLHGKTSHPRMEARIHEYRPASSFIREYSWTVATELETENL